LLILFKENPKDSLLFGGFQGNYYTATEKGELQLASSWGNVRKNIQETLENWDKTAYGLLQAIINKCGTVIDRDVAAEIVKILGPGYPWQEELSLYKRLINIFPDIIQALSILIDKMEIGELKKCTNSSLRGSVNILEGFLNKEFPDYDRNLISNFRNIITLRSKRHPIHSDDPRLINALEYFGFNYPPDDWEKLWKTVLNKYLESLKLLLEHLNTTVDEESQKQ
jgi:hypothetical protein